jgi:tripartite-type tricarboxylate transporter receptor subunit TctC
VAPEVPTVAETTGIKDFDFTLWSGIFVPARTPAPIVAQLNAAINKVLEEPDTRRRLAEVGAETNPMSVDAFKTFVNKESSHYLGIIKESGLTAQ